MLQNYDKVLMLYVNWRGTWALQRNCFFSHIMEYVQLKYRFSRHNFMHCQSENSYWCL